MQPGGATPGNGSGMSDWPLADDRLLAEGPDRVEDLVVERRAGQRPRPRRGGDGRFHLRVVLEQERVVAAGALDLFADHRLELADPVLRRARLVLHVDAAVLERVDGLLEVAAARDRRRPGRPADRASPTWAGSSCTRRPRRVWPRPSLSNSSTLQPAAFAASSRSVMRLAGTRCRPRAGWRSGRRRRVTASTTMTATATASTEPRTIARRLRRPSLAIAARSASSRSRRRRSFSSLRLDISGAGY